MEKSKLEIKQCLIAQVAAGYISAVGTGQEPREVVRYATEIAELILAGEEVYDAPSAEAPAKKRGRPAKVVA